MPKKRKPHEERKPERGDDEDEVEDPEGHASSAPSLPLTVLPEFVEPVVHRQPQQYSKKGQRERDHRIDDFALGNQMHEITSHQSSLCKCDRQRDNNGRGCRDIERS